jgi:serine O-acetyltransferase
MTPKASSGPRGAFATDVAKYYAIELGGNRAPAGRIRFWLFHSDFHCVACFRFGQAAHRLYSRSKLLGFLPLVVGKLWRRWGATIHHVEIDHQAKIGPGFYIMHRNGIVIGPSPIGDNCVLHHNVTIGQRVAAGDKGVPRLGDNVWIGPGATIYGDITIGNNVTIAAGTVISKSVPDNSLVAGNPGRVIQRDYDNRSIINFTVPKPQDGQLDAGGATNRVQRFEPLGGLDPVDHEERP